MIKSIEFKKVACKQEKWHPNWIEFMFGPYTVDLIVIIDSEDTSEKREWQM